MMWKYDTVLSERKKTNNHVKKKLPLSCVKFHNACFNYMFVNLCNQHFFLFVLQTLKDEMAEVTAEMEALDAGEDRSVFGFGYIFISLQLTCVSFWPFIPFCSPHMHLPPANHFSQASLPSAVDLETSHTTATSPIRVPYAFHSTPFTLHTFHNTSHFTLHTFSLKCKQCLTPYVFPSTLSFTLLSPTH